MPPGYALPASLLQGAADGLQRPIEVLRAAALADALVAALLIQVDLHRLLALDLLELRQGRGPQAQNRTAARSPHRRGPEVRGCTRVAAVQLRENIWRRCRSSLHSSYGNSTTSLLIVPWPPNRPGGRRLPPSSPPASVQASAVRAHDRGHPAGVLALVQASLAVPAPSLLGPHVPPGAYRPDEHCYSGRPRGRKTVNSELESWSRRRELNP